LLISDRKTETTNIIYILEKVVWPLAKCISGYSAPKSAMVMAAPLPWSLYLSVTSSHFRSIPFYVVPASRHTHQHWGVAMGFCHSTQPWWIYGSVSGDE